MRPPPAPRHHADAAAEIWATIAYEHFALAGAGDRTSLGIGSEPINGVSPMRPLHGRPAPGRRRGGEHDHPWRRRDGRTFLHRRGRVAGGSISSTRRTPCRNAYCRLDRASSCPRSSARTGEHDVRRLLHDSRASRIGLRTVIKRRPRALAAGTVLDRGFEFVGSVAGEWRMPALNKKAHPPVGSPATRRHRGRSTVRQLCTAGTENAISAERQASRRSEIMWGSPRSAVDGNRPCAYLIPCSLPDDTTRDPVVVS